MIIPIIASILIALLAVNWIYFKVLRIAKDKNLVDNPDARKLQKEPVPVMGGIAVFFGVIAGVLAGAVVFSVLGLTPTAYLLPIMLAMALMLYVGAMDDISGLTPISRICIEIFMMVGLIFASGGCIDSLHGIWGIYSFSWWIAVPFTIFAGVGIVNAMNMIDGVNGLSSGLCITCSILFGVSFIKVGDYTNALLAFSMAAALLPFLVHNVFGLRSRMFIGDAGTMVMGALMSWFTICALRSDSGIEYYRAASDVNMVAFSLAVLSVPVFDTIRVMVMRMVHGRSPFHPDKTHLHHAFVLVGISHSITSFSEILIDLCVVLIWSISVKLGASPTVQLYCVIVSAVALVWGTYVILSLNARYHTKFLHWLTHLSIKTHLGRKDWWKRLTAWLDKPEDKMIAKAANVPQAVHVPEQIDPNDVIAIDRKKIRDFMKGRAEVFVEDIKRNSGADPSRVYPIIFEEVMAGRVVIIRENRYGVPDIVSLV